MVVACVCVRVCTQRICDICVGWCIKFCSIPNSVSTGMFFVNCENVHTHLCQKRRAMANAILTVMCDKARGISDKLFEEFSGIARRIQQKAANIEELTQQKDFTNTGDTVT